MSVGKFGECPRCGSQIADLEYGGERGEKGPFVVCKGCGYDEEDDINAKAAVAELQEMKVNKLLPNKEKKWWDDLPAEVVSLARRLVPTHVSPDHPVVPFDAVRLPVPTGAGVVTLVRDVDLAPLWTAYVHLARHALDTVNGPLQPAVPDPTHLPQPYDVEKAWRVDSGLDLEDEAT